MGFGFFLVLVRWGIVGAAGGGSLQFTESHPMQSQVAPLKPCFFLQKVLSIMLFWISVCVSVLVSVDE